MLSYLTGKASMVLGGAVAAITALLALFSYGAIKKREGASEAATEALLSDIKKVEKANEAAYEEQASSKGIPISDVVDRLRSRDNDWRKL